MNKMTNIGKILRKKILLLYHVGPENYRNLDQRAFDTIGKIKNLQQELCLDEHFLPKYSASEPLGIFSKDSNHAK
jgi:hypothetical protein